MTRRITAIAPALLLVAAAFAAGKAPPPRRRPRPTGPPDPPASHYEPRTIRGWTLRVHRDLLAEAHAALWAEVRAELDNHLYRIGRVVPAKALAELKKVPLWIEYDNPKGRHAHYHPSADWLKANGYNPAKVKGVEIGSARNFLRAVRHQPWVILHELAHAYHDRVLGFEQADILAAYNAAKASGTYEKVLIWNGRVGRHYAMTNQKEYFAENTEAYFGTNDIYPFVRAELKRHDPKAYAAIEKAWGVTP